MELKTEIMVTEAAKSHLLKGAAGADGLRLIIKGGKGCGGNEYDFQPIKSTDTVSSDDYIKLDDNFNLYIDPADVLRLFGTRIDFIEDELGNRRIDIINPNETGRCGCGKSVTF